MKIESMLYDAFIIAFAVFFIHACTWEGMILEKLRELTFEWPQWITKPLYDCPICMAPWWGSAILLLMGHGWSWVPLIVAGGINTVIIQLMSHGQDEDRASFI